MEYRSMSGRKYVLGEQRGGGGEGKIYDILNYCGLVAKLYYRNLCTSYRERKLIAMMRLPLSPEADLQVAWPRDILYDSMGNFVGFVMQKVDGVPLNVIYDEYKELGLPKLVTIAKNLCAAVYHIHTIDGVVIGDLNVNNILVNPTTGMVQLVDADSYHITDDHAKVYRCEVCIPEYLCPSVVIPKGETLKTAQLPTFSRESDEFALAVHVFQLLMGGSHPFTLALARGNDSEYLPQPADNIKKHLFPYNDCPGGYRLPVYSLPYKMLSERLRFMFIKRFSKGEHIPIERWYAAVCEFEKELTKTCKWNPNHKFHKNVRRCPYCQTDKRTTNFLKNSKKY